LRGKMSGSSILEKGFVPRRTAANPRGFDLLLLSFHTLGIIYSDIGTSPLYTLNGIWPYNGPGSAPPAEDVIGGVSAIIWSLTLLPLLKYVFICLRFGTGEGEGGTFALYQGLYPPSPKDLDSDRILTGDTHKENTKPAPKLYESFRWPLLIWCLLGTSLTMADGVFTPAVSITSAVGGIQYAKPSLTFVDVTGISIAFLVVFFLAQPFGTSRLAFTFAPITLVWFLLLAATGIVNIVAHPGILRAFDPSRAIMLFVRTKNYGLLSGVLLALTGCEAMFANLGQFSRLSIQISFTGVVYPAVVLAYLGQGARVIRDGDAVMSNIFYATVPGKPNGPLYWIIYIFGILATLIASQALTTATFSLIQQIVNMKSLPPIRMVYTSDKLYGQVYVPLANWTLMCATIIVVGAFKSSIQLSNAYGFAVATVMFSTSILIAIQMRFVKGLPIIIAVGFFIVFGFLDGLFWGAALKKVPQGAWVPLMLGIIMMIVMSFWTWVKRLEDKFDDNNRKNLKHFIIPHEDGTIEIPPQSQHDLYTIRDMSEAEAKKESTYYYLSEVPSGDDSSIEKPGEKRLLTRISVPTCAIFHKTSGGRGVPHSFVEFVRQWPSLPRVVIFLSVCVVASPRVSLQDRYAVEKVRTIEGFYGVTYYIGYREDFEVDTTEVINRVCILEAGANPRGSNDAVRYIREAASCVTHIVPHYYVFSKPVQAQGKFAFVANAVRSFLIEDVYRVLASMCPETIGWVKIPKQTIFVGVQAEI